MPFLRKIVFYIFVAIYLVICPILILRMLGFVRDPQTGHLVKTGLIYVSSNPPGAHVYLNGRMMPETTPTIIRDLAPGPYTVRMELAGYESWENAVPVAYKKATSVENILLIPTQWKIRPLYSQPLSKLIPIPDNNYLLVSTDNTVEGLFVLRLDRNIEDKPDATSDLEQLFPEESIYREGRVVRYFTVPASPFFILEVALGEKHKYLWVDPRDKQVHIEDISDLIQENPKRLYWESNDEKNIYAFYPHSVNHINIKAKAIYPNIPHKEIPVIKRRPHLIVPVHANQVFWINNDNTLLFRRDNDTFLMDEEPFGMPRLTEILRVKDNTDIYFSDKTGKMYYIDARNNLLSSIQILHHKPFIPKPIADTLRLKKLEE